MFRTMAAGASACTRSRSRRTWLDNGIVNIEPDATHGQPSTRQKRRRPMPRTSPMQPWHALQLALAAEQRAEAFFGALAAAATTSAVRKAALEFQAEEAEHTALVRLWMEKQQDQTLIGPTTLTHLLYRMRDCAMKRFAPDDGRSIGYPQRY